MRNTNGAWLLVRGWTDRTLRNRGRAWKQALLPAFLPFFILIAFDKVQTLSRDDWRWAAAAIWFVGWLLFVGWRFWRMMREAGIKGDRHYDREGKYDLPPEYADSESATKARRRRK
jgi:type VI protein secretion system component VasK